MGYWNLVFRGAAQRTLRPMGWGPPQIAIVLVALGVVLKTLILHGWGAALVSAADYFWLAFPPVFAAAVLFAWGVIQAQRDLYLALGLKLEAQNLPDYEAWAHRDRFTLREAAFLWRDKKIHGEMPPDVAEWCTALMAAVNSGDLGFVTTPQRGAPPERARDAERSNPTKATIVTREHLKAFAQRHGYDPRFLRD